MSKYNDLIKLKNFEQINIICHCDPDADALSSMIVMKDFLTEQFKIKTVNLFGSCDKISKQAQPIIDGYNIFTSLNQLKQANLSVENFTTNNSATVLLDCANVERIGELKEIFSNAKFKVSIDHHATNNVNADIYYLENISSTCEIIFKICKEFNYNLSQKNLGKLYAGIITDTNNFSVGNFSGESLSIAGQCITSKQHLIYKNFFENNSLKNMQVLSKAIDSIITVKDGQGIIAHITHEQAKNMNLITDDYIGIINRLNTIQNSKLVAFIYPKNENYYVGLRAKIGFDVAKIAEKYSGGGHSGAAGFLINENIEKIIEIIKKEFKNKIDLNNENDEEIF